MTWSNSPRIYSFPLFLKQPYNVQNFILFFFSFNKAFYVQKNKITRAYILFRNYPYSGMELNNAANLPFPAGAAALPLLCTVPAPAASAGETRLGLESYSLENKICLRREPHLSAVFMSAELALTANAAIS